MTAERIDMADPDNLLLLDTEAVNSSLASAPIEQNEPARASDAQTDDSFSPNPDPAPESSGIKPIMCRDETVDIHSQNIHKEEEKFDIDAVAVMEIDNIMDSINNSDLIHITNTDSMTENHQKDKHDLKSTEDTHLACGTLLSTEVSSLTEHNHQEEMSKDAVLNQHLSFESVSQAANDDNTLVNIDSDSDVLISEQTLQVHETDAISSQICLDKPEGFDLAPTAYKTLPEMHNESQNLLCRGFTIAETPNTGDLKTDAPNITHASILLDSSGMNKVLDTVDVPVNSQMIQTVNTELATPNTQLSITISTQTVENLVEVLAHDESQSCKTDTVLDQYTSSEGVGKMTHDDNPMVYTVCDVINTEQSLGQHVLIPNSETNATSSESLIQTYRDTPEVVDKTLPEMDNHKVDLTFGQSTISTTPDIGDLKTGTAICLAETDAPNITHSSILLDSLKMIDVLETADLQEIIQSVNEDLVAPNTELSTTLSTHTGLNPVQLSEIDTTASESNRTDNILDHYEFSKSTGLEVSVMDNNDNPMLNAVSGAVNSEQCPNQPFLISNNETNVTSSESLIQTFQDTPEGVDVAEEVTTYKAPLEMHDETEDLTCCGFTTSQIPKIEKPKTDNPSLAELREADTLNILTHATALLDSLGMNNSVLETADVPVNDSEIIHTVNKDLASSSLKFCATTLIVTLPKDSIDAMEMESNIIGDFIDSMSDTIFPLEVSRVQTSEACWKNPSDTVVNSESPQIPETPQAGEKHLSQVTPCPKPVTDVDLGNRSEEIEGACLKFKGTEHDVEAGNELWLDACQFLAGEEDERAIFDKCGRSCSTTPPLAHPDNTKASDYSRREDISIDHQAEDWELKFPPVERWSSSDSWASAFSDWFQAVNTYPEDSFDSANTLSTGSKFSMAIQDNILAQRTSSDNAANAGQSLSVNLLESDEPGQALNRGLVEPDNTNGTVLKQGDKHGLSSHSDSDRQENTNMESLLEIKSESHKPDKNSVMDTFNASKSCVSSENEVNAKPYGRQHISGDLLGAKLEGNALVIEDKVCQFGLVFEQECECSFPSPRISAYTRDKNLTGGVSDKEQGHSSGVDLCISPSQSDSDASSKAGLVEGNGSLVHSNNVDYTVKPRNEQQSAIPQFIMPFAPLCTGNTFLCHDFLKTDSPQSELDLHPKRIINEINFKSDQKSVSGDESSEDCFHTCPDQSLSSSCGDSDDPSVKDTGRKADYSETCDISKELSNLILLTGEHFMLSEDKRVAYVTLDLDESKTFCPFSLSNCEKQPIPDNMPHKTSKTSSDGKTRSKHKEKQDDKKQNGIQTSKKQDVQPQVKNEINLEEASCEDRPVTVIETIVITEKVVPKAQGKKKKKHAQHGAQKPENDPPSDGGNRCAQQNASIKTEILEVKVASNKSASQPSTKMDITNKDSTQKVISVRPKVETGGNSVAKMDPASVNATQKASPVKLKVDSSNTAKMENKTCTSDSPSTCLPNTLNEDIKRRRIADDLTGAIPIRTRPQLPAIFRQGRKDGEDTTRRAYSEVVKQKTPAPKEVVLPRVVSEIQADPVPTDPQNILLWCQFSPVPPGATIKWTKEETVLLEINKIEKDDGRFTLTIIKACSKDLGLYKCSLNATNISVSTAEYHLTSEVLMELVIPSHDEPAEHRVVDGDEENIQCSPLLFKDDFLSDQYFGENQPASILTEKIHFGEGMHRKAFRTTLREGNLPRFNPGHPCVLKVHNAIGYGTKTNEELVQKNYSLAVEECHVQNTAREYIKAYHSVAKTAESFGEVPEIIPIYLVHRPSNNIPYATLEEELLGDFVKYSVKDGKEINLMRRDSEAGQKCCAFQHWVYTQTDGNLLVTDMQGVGMRLTDVGIATGKKGYKGFRGNCSTSFIDQFKALHQCNRYCELLGLVSLQPKPKRPVAQPKPKTQPTPKKKPFGSVLNAKS